MSGFLRSGHRRNGKVSVTVLPGGKTVELSSGARLLDAVLLAGNLIRQHCGGRARCGVCHVRILHGERGLSKVGKGESYRLSLIGAKALSSRLSCQAVLGHHEITIELVEH